jgi:hypothetical protein
MTYFKATPKTIVEVENYKGLLSTYRILGPFAASLIGKWAVKTPLTKSQRERLPRLLARRVA